MTQLQTTLRQLRLSGLLQTLAVRLQEAAAGRLGHGEFLELLLQDERNVRHQRRLARRTNAADFRARKTLAAFDWWFHPTINRQQICELAAGNYLRAGKAILFPGPPGIGKTHWAQALGYEAINPDSEVELPQRTQGAQREGCRAGPPGKNLAWFGTHQTRCPAVRFFAFFAANFGIRVETSLT
jgi:hypothetical protein